MNLKSTKFMTKNTKEPIFFIVSIIGLIWTILILISSNWNIDNLFESKRDLATSEARANWNKDQAFRSWATLHGGLYVQPNKRTPPSPYLAHIPKRDVVTTDGMKLTLMNPAYMMRQMTEEFESTYGIKGSITGKILLNPINAPDKWERKVLDRFEEGEKEVIEEVNINNKPYIRLMKPMVMKEGCMKCHGHLGFKVGDIRGGVSISIPLSPYFELAKGTARSIQITHISIWSLGWLVLFIYAFTACRRQNEHIKYNEHLEELVSERTDELRIVHNTLVRKERLATLGQLTATVSHELRNPLGAMRPSLYIIEKKSDKEDERLQQAITRVDRSIDRCDRIIDELLDFTRITELNKKSTHIDEWLESLIAEQVIPDGIQLEKNFSLKGVIVDVDTERLRRAIINIFENACHSMMDDNQKVVTNKSAKLKIKTAKNKNRVEITVSDTGSGISKEVLTKIFEPLFSTKGFGVGLGMPTVKQVMEQHGGGVEIISEIKIGTSVTLWLKNND